MFLAVILAVCLAAVVGWARKAPDFSLPDPNGKKIRLSEQRGKLVVLEFLQTGCPACQRAGRTLQKLFSENQKDLLIIGISHDVAGDDGHSRVHPAARPDLPGRARRSHGGGELPGHHAAQAAVSMFPSSSSWVPTDNF